MQSMRRAVGMSAIRAYERELPSEPGLGMKCGKSLLNQNPVETLQAGGLRILQNHRRAKPQSVGTLAQS